jgi:crotonobetainyl-CoA:carnitine CoA-transferase CaiB-like acyl-CoA transferase
MTRSRLLCRGEACRPAAAPALIFLSQRGLLSRLCARYEKIAENRANMGRPSGGAAGGGAPPPRLAEHSAEVLAELGCSAAEIAEISGGGPG